MKAKKVLQIVRALDFAAWAHSAQRRKGGEREPYVNHLTEVARLAAQATKGRDDKLIIAALLHDVLEDQAMRVNYKMLKEKFGKRVARIVREVTDDRSLPKAERKRLQVVHAGEISPRAKLVKLADKICNLRDILASPPVHWPLQRQQAYFDWSAQVIAGVRGIHPQLEAVFDTLYARRPGQG